MGKKIAAAVAAVLTVAVLNGCTKSQTPCRADPTQETWAPIPPTPGQDPNETYWPAPPDPDHGPM
jgi:hypothetical protein